MPAMRLAVIPARGGSKRIPRKNIRAFNGAPMMAYAVRAAIESGMFDRVIVSTEDMEIAQVAKDIGADVPFVRPLELADDHTPTVPVVDHAIRACQSLGWDVQEVCCIYPCVPMISVLDLKTSYTTLMSSGAPYVFPVTEFPSAVQRALHRKPNGAVHPFYPQYAATRTQDLEAAYYDAGQFYWGHAWAWQQGISIHQNGLTLAIPSWRVVDIDSPADWERAELLYAAWQGRGGL